ncbi:hypothetical protein COCMIDRAFT_107995 [Bipolaris oryzae ATCC 44560]|uniref:Uncharacterized protein n=1 Tax=Bipolaris oryzae ATCC 44560 TaxID=930090 RepID=W6YT35_COCMI|nr:uncharacterized protein COCMIDRAFT_107995 [Bipolaris oryzae ATCC 44560]EUC40750.1 hypothetical protein COCMIDRAFT_107995 [Bipolaris oryzae ATCC 44560]
MSSRQRWLESGAGRERLEAGGHSRAARADLRNAEPGPYCTILTPTPCSYACYTAQVPT